MSSPRRAIYLDWNATAPPHPDVIEAMRRASEDAWANPASVHGPGRRARAHVEAAREAVAELVGYDARDVTLTSGGTEANNLALCHAFPSLVGSAAVAMGAPLGAPGSASRPPAAEALVVSRIEHPSVVRTAEALAARGVRVVWIEPHASGVIEPDAVADAIDRAAKVAEVKLVSLQAVNHETGVVQPIAKVAAIVRARGILLHVDAVQAVGRVPREAWEGADLVTIAAHKIRGPKGIGALATRAGLRLVPVLHGGAQERGVRPGTQDPAACAGFAVAAFRAGAGPARYAVIAALRDQLEEELGRAGEELGAAPLRNGDAARAPHVSNLSWPGWLGPELCAALDLEGVAVSSGSACSAGTADPSPVLRAMLGEERARSAVRVSLGEETTSEEVREAISKWKRVLSRTPARS